MPVYKVFTWNIQRAQSVSRPRQDAKMVRSQGPSSRFGSLRVPALVSK